jgi:hypothetical protein
MTCNNRLKQLENQIANSALFQRNYLESLTDEQLDNFIDSKVAKLGIPEELCKKYYIGGKYVGNNK